MILVSALVSIVLAGLALSDIGSNTQTVRGLRVLCSYDTNLHESLQTGDLVADPALMGATTHHIFSIDPSSCRLVNGGADHRDGRLFRGTLDGRVLAYGDTDSSRSQAPGRFIGKQRAASFG